MGRKTIKRDSKGRVIEVEYKSQKQLENEGCGGCLMILIILFILASLGGCC